MSDSLIALRYGSILVLRLVQWYFIESRLLLDLRLKSINQFQVIRISMS